MPPLSSVTRHSFVSRIMGLYCVRKPNYGALSKGFNHTIKTLCEEVEQGQCFHRESQLGNDIFRTERLSEK